MPDHMELLRTQHQIDAAIAAKKSGQPVAFPTSNDNIVAAPHPSTNLNNIAVEQRRTSDWPQKSVDEVLASVPVNPVAIKAGKPKTTKAPVWKPGS